MTDVYAIFGTLLALGIAFPGFLAALWLLFPDKVAACGERLETSTAKSFWVGLGTAIALAIPISLLNALGGPFAFLAVVLFLAVLAIASIGAAGLAGRLGARVRERIAGDAGPLRGFLLGALALELAAAFPLVGWFIVIPGALVTSLGASARTFFQRRPAGEAQPLAAQGEI